MKKLILITAAALVSEFGFSQPFLTFDTHALKPGENNPMLYCEYAEAGPGGVHVIWDFTHLEQTKEFTGYIDNDPDESFFSNSNTVLREFGNSFFYDVSPKGVRQTGYLSEDKNTKIVYTKPYEKIRYPFTFGDTYSSTFEGQQIYSGKVIAELAGNSYVAADGRGKLILPGVVFENTIRIKNVKMYTLTYSSGGSNEVTITTYRWYNNVHRYPLLVLTEIVSGASRQSTSHQAAYNPEAVKELRNILDKSAEEKLTLYPNPVHTELNVLLESEKSGVATYSIYDLSGKTIYAQGELEYFQGGNEYSFENELTGLMPGMYIFDIAKDSERIIKEFVVLK